MNISSCTVQNTEPTVTRILFSLRVKQFCRGSDRTRDNTSTTRAILLNKSYLGGARRAELRTTVCRPALARVLLWDLEE
jgi:hypothetical protein